MDWLKPNHRTIELKPALIPIHVLNKLTDLLILELLKLLLLWLKPTDLTLFVELKLHIPITMKLNNSLSIHCTGLDLELKNLHLLNNEGYHTTASQFNSYTILAET
jgi:hypothetical protein